MYRVLLLICLLSLLLHALTPLEANGQLHVDSATGQLRNEANEITRLRGMSSHGLQWYGGMINETSIRALQEDWRADVLRLSCYVQEDGYEKLGTNLLTFADKAIEDATAQGLYVIIDFHMLTPGNPIENSTYATTFFTHMASTHGDKENIFYEICNEPNNDGGSVKIPNTNSYHIANDTTVSWDMIKVYADSIVSLIRTYDSNNIILVGTPNWCQDVQDVIGNRIEDQNLMYTVHFYASAHKEIEREKARTALEANIPVFVTEFGTQSYSGSGFNDFESSNAWFELLDSFHVSWVNWNFSYHGYSGAVFTTYPTSYDFTNYEFYIDTTNLKPAGQWIKAHLQEPDSWDPITPIHVLKKETKVVSPILSFSSNRITLSGTASSYSLALFTTAGRKVWSTTTSSPSTLALPHSLPKGAFILQIIGVDQQIEQIVIRN